MSQENLSNTESIGKRSPFLRPLVDKIRSIDTKWILAGTFIGGIITGALIANHNPVLAAGAFGMSIAAAGLLFCATDAFEIPSRY